MVVLVLLRCHSPVARQACLRLIGEHVLWRRDAAPPVPAFPSFPFAVLARL